jgi:hypothetical protein
MGQAGTGIQQIEALVHKVESLTDHAARQTALDLVQAIMDFHGAGLERMMELISETGETGDWLFQAFAQDEKVQRVLLLYGLHPVDLETRVTNALESVRITVLSRNASAHLISVDDGLVRVRVDGANPFNGSELKAEIEEAIYAAAPDANGVVIQGIPEPAAGFVPLAALLSR